MRKISTVGLICCDKFEETPKQKVIDLSKFKKFYFNNISLLYSNWFNIASMQDTANDHTNQMGDFIDPLCFL